MTSGGRTSAVLVAALIGVGVVVGRLVPPIVVRFGGNVPQVGWGPAIALIFVAVVVGGFAWSTWQSLHRRKERMTSAHGLRMLALARSSILVSSCIGGVYGGLALAYLGSLHSTLGQERALRAGAAAVAAALLLVAALLLERACQIPGGDDEADGAEEATPA